ncbi:hypothetical protein, partial [Acinetobacter baumannii]|uniref:hypothetical protein n=1 Tax=Acinetobacter baumannii TaxID=470 RepID=UPI001C09BDAB
MSLTVEAGTVPALFARQRRRLAVAAALLIVLFVVLAVISLGTGAVAIPPARVLAVVRGWLTGDA